jgi:hypothetical protein
MTLKPRPPKPAIGWREWISFPDLGVRAIKAKIDTGARTSALHAFDIHRFRRRGKRMVRFKVHPLQKNSRETVEAVAPLVDERTVRSSAGHEQHRPVILATISFNGESWPIEVTLTSRDTMGFRMLLGRQAIRGRFSVDPGRSFIGGRPAHLKKKKRKKSSSSNPKAPS